MIDSIQTFGDSFIYGSDLSDCLDNSSQPSQLTWPALVAKDLKLNYKCYSMGGVGNRYISDNIITNSQINSLIIINWTWLDRFDFYSSDTRRLRKNVTIRPSNTDLRSKFFYKEIHSEEDDKFRSLSYIYATHSYLKSNNIPFISTYMDQQLFSHSDLESFGIIKLQDLIRKDLRTFPQNQTFLEWSRANEYSESNNWHPLELAHERAAKYWLPIYEKEISKHITTT
jgi:hypothetical protein